MAALFDRMTDGFAKLKWVAAGAGVLFWLFVCKLCGASLVDLLRFSLSVLFYLLFPGLFFVRLSGLEERLPFFRIPLGILYGTGFLAVLYCFCMRLGLLPVLYAVPPVLGILYLWKQKLSRERIRAALCTGSFRTLLLVWAVCLVLCTCALCARNPHPMAAGTATLNEDMLWNIGNANAFQLQFPPEDIRFSEVRFAYHYLTEMIWGILSLVSGVKAFDVFFYFAPPFFLAALLACLYGLGLAFFRGGKRRALTFPVVLLCFGCLSLWKVYGIGSSIFSNRLLEHMLTNINAQSTGFIFLSISFVLFREIAAQSFRVNWRSIFSFWGAFILTCFAKGPQAAIFACALGIVFLFTLFRRPNYGKAILTYGGSIASFALVYLFVFSSGANTSMQFDLLAATKSASSEFLIPWMDRIHLTGYFAVFLLALVNIFCMVPFQTVLFLPGLVHDLRRLFQLPEDRLLAYGTCAGGFLAYYLFVHPNSSQVYFAYIGIFFLTLLAVDGLGRLKKSFFSGIIVVCAVLALLTTVMQCSVFAGSGLRNILYNTQLAQRPEAASYATAGDEEAMLWLRENSDPDDIFVTNRIDTQPGSGNGISNLYSALSSRQAFMEGYAYAVSNMGVSAELLEEKQTVNAAFFDAGTSDETLREYAETYDISWIVFSKQFPGEICESDEFAAVYENDRVMILKRK